ncbi:hypothetical protein D3C75_951820 [compost metagenome]
MSEFRLIDFAAFFPADGFGDDVAVPVLAFIFRRIHRATVDHDRRNVQPCRRHQHGRHNFVAGSQQYHAVEAMGAHHHFN